MLNKYLEAAQPPRIVCCFVGKFNPFHKAHYQAYVTLREHFPYVYIVTKLDSDGFLNAEQKKQLIKLSGVPEKMIKHLVGAGYSIESLAQSVNAVKSNILVAAFSEKDMEEKGPALLNPPKKGGLPAWRMMPKDPEDMTPIMAEEKNHGYIYVLPSMKVGVSEVSSSRIRRAIENGNWGLVNKMMATDEAYNFLKDIKDNE